MSTNASTRATICWLWSIWYLMRASRRVRAKLDWFVEFPRVFFDSDELT